MALQKTGMDKVEVVIAGSPQRPLSPGVQPSWAPLPHPTGDNQLGIGVEHRLRADQRVGGNGVSEDIFPAAKSDDISDQVVTIDCHQWRGPDLIKQTDR